MDISKFENFVSQHTPYEVSTTAQQILEDTLLNGFLKILFDTKNILLSGGIFANVKLNQKIRQTFQSCNIYVNPVMGDMGLALAGIEPYTSGISDSRGVFVGPSYDASDLSFIDNTYNVRDLENIDEIVNYLIACFDNNSPVGIFHGPMEYGPRSLCHRSIVFSAKSKNANDLLNKRLKRSDFMPFAPVILDIDAPKYLIGYSSDQETAVFMTMTYECTDYFCSQSPAVVHIDRTARPQVLTENRDPWMYKLLYTYTRRTGEACLINTSLNNHEEPIVCNLEDALKSLDRRNIDALLFARSALITRIP